MAKTHWSGKDLRTVLFVDDEKLDSIDATSFSLQAVGTTVTDGILGKDRTINDFILDHYKGSWDIQQKTVEMLSQMLKIQDNRDANGVELSSVAGLVINFHDATRKLYTMSEITFCDWSLAVAGRADRNKMTVPFIANRFKDST